MNQHNSNSTAEDSHAAAVKRFSSRDTVASYPAVFGNKPRHKSELKCLLRAIEAIPGGASVLDLPCGTGRLTPILLNRGYRVTGADVSAGMIDAARENTRKFIEHSGEDYPAVDFELKDIQDTGYADDQFDAVVCNRLFHHFTESETRIRALTELRRICTGPIVVSFYNLFAMDAVRFFLRHWLRGEKPGDRVPVAMSVFADDIAASGLKIQSRHARQWGISPMWYVVLVRK